MTTRLMRLRSGAPPALLPEEAPALEPLLGLPEAMEGAVADASRHMARFSCLALPSEFEGLPNVVAEAMACEVACVAYHEGHFATSSARIRVVKTEHLGLDQPHVCRQCRPARSHHFWWDNKGAWGRYCKSCCPPD